MQPPLETIRLSRKAREQLITLKRRTGLRNWNVLCRWAFCVSLADPHPPSDLSHVGDAAVEMTWKTFGGRDADAYLALLVARCRRDGLGVDRLTLARQFILHLHRGIGTLATMKDLRSIADLVGLSVVG